MKKLKTNLVILFIYYFLVMFLIDYFFLDHEAHLYSNLLFSFIFAVFMTIHHKYVDLDYQPVYLKLSAYDKVMEELTQIGYKLKKVKGEKSFYRLSNDFWPFNQIIVKKTPFYMYIKAPLKYAKRFQEMKSEYLQYRGRDELEVRG